VSTSSSSEPVTVLPYLTDWGFANELKLRIWEGDIILEVSAHISVLVSRIGRRALKEAKRWSRGGNRSSLCEMGGLRRNPCRSLKR
jgi:hypothetical protein